MGFYFIKNFIDEIYISKFFHFIININLNFLLFKFRKWILHSINMYICMKIDEKIFSTYVYKQRKKHITQHFKKHFWKVSGCFTLLSRFLLNIFTVALFIDVAYLFLTVSVRQKGKALLNSRGKKTMYMYIHENVHRYIFITNEKERKRSNSASWEVGKWLRVEFQALVFKCWWNWPDEYGTLIYWSFSNIR